MTPSGTPKTPQSSPAREPPTHAASPESLAARFEANVESGLSASEARRRLERDGPNALPPAKRISRLKKLFDQFTNPIVLTLMAAAVVAMVHGAHATEGNWLARYGDAIAIILIVALNAVLGFYQELRAEAALDALEKMQTPSARVLRDGRIIAIAANDVVVGDVLELDAGDAVTADGRLLTTADLACEESLLTGESVPVGKDAVTIVERDAPLADRANMVFFGTTVLRGRGRALVTSTGARTEVGQLNTLIQTTDRPPTPLEEDLDVFGKRILWACLGLSALLFARGMWRGDSAWHDLFLQAVSLAVAAIPEGLPAITTITLALGMQRMAARGAIIRKLSAVETLGAATIICSDKTGTLTQNAMTVRSAYAGTARYEVTGVGYAPKGEIRESGDDSPATPTKPLRHLLEIVALCNNAQIAKDDDGRWIAQGDPTEAALLTLASKGGLPRESIVSSHKLLHELPFDSDRKRMTIVTLDRKGREVAHVKGGIDAILPLCTQIECEDGFRDITESDRARVTEEAESMSLAAMRVLAVARRIVAERHDESNHADHGESQLEDKLTFVGLVGMIDPPREGAREAVRACADAHVRAVMITGDHKLTAVAIATELGLWDSDAIALTGVELEALSDEALSERIEYVRVFARVTAAQKLRIVRLLKARGHVVAMTGDGVNDAPALREAHIGVAMGKSGTEVARQAAEMVIADDDFATIVHAVREGRSIYRNIQKFIFFLLSANAGLLVAVFAASFLNVSPLTPLMLLWINLVTNGLPALALGIDPPEPGQMLEPPRDPSAGLLRMREAMGIAAVGVWMGGCAIASTVWPWTGEAARSHEHARAVAFSLLALSPLFHAFSCRSATASILSVRPMLSWTLMGAVIISAAIHLVAVLVPPLQPVFKTFPMSSEEWTIMLLLSASIVPVVELLKLLQRARIVGRGMGPLSVHGRD